MAIAPVQSSLIHKVIEPAGDGQPPYPTLILLHGRGTNEDDLLGLAPYLDPRFLIISARAPFQFSMGGWTWYEILEVGSPHPRQFQESYNKLVQFLADLKQHYPVDPSKIFFLGFSMGTVMSFAMALTKPQEIAGVIAHSGYAPENTHLNFTMEKLQNTSFFVAHGVRDPVIPVHFGRRAKELLSSANADLTYREYPIAHQISEESLSDLSSWLRQRLEALQQKK
ncbi:MAG: alpha/beta fold hydrolase [Ignavibacteriae bacterium]|nr:alpha/beta fold hydrolase [Ignavibacteriota bacterium]